MTLVVTLVAWMLPSPRDTMLWIGAGVTVLATYMLGELNNLYSLLRVRSRLVSALYLLLMLAYPALHVWRLEMLTSLCLLAAFFLLFASYQQARPEGPVFHAFLFATVGGMLFPPALVFPAVFYFCMLFQLRSLTLRSFVAGLLGVATPFFLYSSYAILTHRLPSAFDFLLSWLHFERPDYTLLTLPALVTFAVVFLFVLLALIHFFRERYNDKIRTRMLLYVIVSLEVVILCGLVLLPSAFNGLFLLFLLNSAPIIAHYYALARGRFFNFWFNLCFLVLLALAVFNYLCLYGPLQQFLELRPAAGLQLW